MSIRLTEAQIAKHNLIVAGYKADRKASKYRNQRTEYNGARYDSKAEAQRAAELDLMVRSGEVYLWIPQPKFRLGLPENIYIADFFVVAPNKRLPDDGVWTKWWAEDVKGMWTAKFKRDVKLWRQYGPCDLCVISKGKTEIVVGGRRS